MIACGTKKHIRAVEGTIRLKEEKQIKDSTKPMFSSPTQISCLKRERTFLVDKINFDKRKNQLRATGMKSLVILFAALLCLLAAVYVKGAEIVVVSGNGQTGKGSTYASDPFVVLVRDGATPLKQQTVFYRQKSDKNRARVFCVDPVNKLETTMKTNDTGYAVCHPRLGFSPGVATIILSPVAKGPGVEFSVTITETVYVWGWVQIGLTFFFSLVTLAGAALVAVFIMTRGTGTDEMKKVAQAIKDGANGFMKTQYITIGVMAIPLAVFLFLLYGFLRTPSPADPDFTGSKYIIALITSLSFLLGVACSGIAGFVGMWVSVRANLRVAAAAASTSNPYNAAVRVALLSGSFAGFIVVSLSVLGVAGLFTLLYAAIPRSVIDPHQIVGLIVGYSFGASFCALFAQLGGGIFTKAADVGADLVGKVIHELAEDDYRNPAVIADLVGDNVGDCAGRGADLFESIAAENIGAMILAGSLAAQASPQLTQPISYIIFPLLIHCAGMCSTWISLLFVRVRSGKLSFSTDNETTKPLLGGPSNEANTENIQQTSSLDDGEDVSETSTLDNPMWGLGLGMVVSSVLSLISFIVICWWLLSSEDHPSAWWHFAICGFLGVLTSFAFCLITIYYTDYNFPPVKAIMEASRSGAATNIISGIAVGLESAAAPVVIICCVIIASYYAGRSSGIVDADGNPIGGIFGTAVATMGMLSTSSYILAMDVFGPITDNAGGIIEMSNQKPHVRVITDTLDAAGNTTKALTKGYAIGSAALASFLLFSAFMDTITAYSGTPFTVINLATPEVFVGALIGAMLVFLFSSLAIKAVGNAAQTVILEVQRQFNDPNKKISEYKIGDPSTESNRPDYDKCVQIVTRSGLIQMIPPGALAVCVPIIVGFIFRLIGYIENDKFLGPQVVAGFLMVATITGILMALFLNNGGGAWDNAKKGIELFGKDGKGSDTHKASVIGDTVGDPFKDTAGPSIHVLIKLLATITLVLGPMFLNP